MIREEELENSTLILNFSLKSLILGKKLVFKRGGKKGKEKLLLENKKIFEIAHKFFFYTIKLYMG